MSTLLHECLTLAEGSAVRVDRERGFIHNVKVLGWTSANGRTYERTAVTPALYEGRRVCCGHVRSGVERDPRDTYAVLEGVTVGESGVHADRLRLLNPKGEFEQRLLTAAETAPSLFGLSHTARGREKPGSNGTIIEAVESVESVDLVTDPATVSGFFESRQTVKSTVKKLIESLKAKRPGYSRALSEMAEAGIMGADAPMEAPPEASAGDEPTDHKQALKDALKALVDEADTLDEAELIRKIKAILKLIKDEGGGTDVPEEPAEESRKNKAQANLAEQVAQLTAEKLVRKAAGKAGVSLSETLVEALARPGMTEAQASTVVAELKGQSGASAGERPRSAGPIVPARQQGAGAARGGTVQESKLPENADAKAVGRYLNGK